MPFSTAHISYQHRIGVIDIGSNSIRLVVYDGIGRTPLPIFNEKTFCALGKGLALTGKLNPEGKKLARSSIARLLSVARLLDVVELKILATAAIRDATDGAAFVQELEQKHDVGISIISGRREARLAAFGVMAAFHKPQGLVGDLGGGSMELIAIDNHRIRAQDTMPIGPLRLLDSCKNNPEKMRKAIARALAGLSWLKGLSPSHFYAVGGSFRSIARIHMHRAKYPLPMIHHYTVASADLLKLLKVLREMGEQDVAALPGVAGKRAAAIRPAALVLQQVIELTKVPEVVFSTSGIREGYLYEKLSPSVREGDPLIASATGLADIMGTKGYAKDLFAWMSPLCTGEPQSLRHLRLAACALSEIAGRIHPEYRGEWAFHHVLQSSLTGLSHPERVMLALALYYRYQPKLRHEFSVLTLITERERQWARLIGLAGNLAYQLSGGVEGNLAHARLKVLRGEIRLYLASDLKSLLSDTVRKRVEGLGDALKAMAKRRR